MSYAGRIAGRWILNWLLSVSTLPAVAQSPPSLAFCESRGEPVESATDGVRSISQPQLLQCLRAGQPVKRHRIRFEDYRDAWQTLARERGHYRTPVLLERATIFADGTDIDLAAFKNPRISWGADMSAKGRKQFEIDSPKEPVELVEAEIRWQGVILLGTLRAGGILFAAPVQFPGSTFLDKARFSSEELTWGARYSETSASNPSSTSRALLRVGTGRPGTRH